jgi:DNA topoisomerase-1
VTDDSPGITRRTHGLGIAYCDLRGRLIRDRRELKRIQSIVIPPAWTDVWICPDPDGHIQATGRDARGRKQYRYHPDWRSLRDRTKYHRMLDFGKALPRIRRRVDRHLRSPSLGRERVLAAAVRVLDFTGIRVGNREYERENNSYGLTTLRGRHVRVNGSQVAFDFVGKSGRRQRVRLTDRRLARAMRRIGEIPGQRLFRYLDEQGRPHDIASDDVNAYIAAVAGDDFTAKDFRTWHGTVAAATLLAAQEPCDSQAMRKKNVVAAIRDVAHLLGNRPATCRKYYVHPAVTEQYLETGVAALKVAPASVGGNGLRAEEKMVLKLLKNVGPQTR